MEAAGENLSNAILVDTGKTFSGKFDDSYTKDECYYKFELKQNSIIKLYVETGGHSQGMTLTLRDSNGKSLPNDGSYLTTKDTDNWGYQSASRKIALNKGTYYLQASNYDWEDAYYNIEVTILTKASSKVKIAGCENNYRNKALVFNVGDKLTSIAQSNYYNHFENEHHYKFKVKSARSVILNFSTKINKHKSRFYIDICDSTGKNRVL